LRSGGQGDAAANSSICLQEVGYASITVQQLADRADLGRATFYQHFHDKDALLRYVVQRLIADLAAHLPHVTTPNLFGEDRLMVAAIFERAKAERRLYRGLCSAKGSAMAIRRIQQFVAARLEERMVRPLAAEAPRPPSDATVGMLAFYVAGALLDLLAWWLDHRCRETPEEMALLLRRLTVPGIARVLGVTMTSSETA
jgi:AcrR family transcriptional regulator